MKDLTILEPEWFDRDRANFIANARKTLRLDSNLDSIKFHIFSNVCHKCVIEGYRRLSDFYLTCVYNFDDNTYVTLHEGEYCNFEFCLGSCASYYSGSIKTSNFIYAEIYTGHTNKYGELDETCLFILDSKFNNAPNLSGKDVLDPRFKCIANIVGDLLYFEYKGVRYLVDGDYGVVAKFPKKLDVAKNIKHATSDTKHFILKDGKGWCLYDVNKKKIIVKNIVAVGESSSCDFKTKEGDIYKYDRSKGEFCIESLYDPFCNDLTEVLVYPYESYTTIRRSISGLNPGCLVHVMKNKKGKFFLVHNNKVINKNCPFDFVKLITDEYSDDEGKFICKANDIEDIYESYDKFRFNALNLSGKQEKLWFDTEEIVNKPVRSSDIIIL